MDIEGLMHRKVNRLLAAVILIIIAVIAALAII